MSRETIPSTGLWGVIAGLLNTNFLNLFRAHQMCQISISHPDPAVLVTVVGTGDKDLNPADGGYVPVLNAYESVLVKGDAFTVRPDGRLQVNRTGLINASAYADISHSSNNSAIGAVFAIERNSVVTFSPRAVHARMPNAGDVGHLSGVGLIDAQAGDIIGIAIASSVSGNISLRSSSIIAQHHGELN